jgi:hypothetical protein
MATQTNAFDDLVRGATVVVGETFSDEELHGAKMKIASKGVVKCNGGKRCADNAACVGLALFLTDPKTFDPEPDGNTGWRSNTTKICLTHLKDTNGKALLSGKRAKASLASGEQEPEKVAPKKSGRRRKTLVKSSSGEDRAAAATLPPPVVEEVPEDEVQMTAPPLRTLAVKVVGSKSLFTAQEFADAIAKGDVNCLRQWIVDLRNENDNLRRLLTDVQQHLISRLL